jgi:hypothetical protein
MAETPRESDEKRPADMFGDVLAAADLVGVLGRSVMVRLVNISGSGCLLESEIPLDAGMTGVISFRLEGREYVDDIRITRCQPRQGASGLHQLGTEFLWVSSPGPYSLRRLVSRIQASAISGQIEFRPHTSVM